MVLICIKSKHFVRPFLLGIVCMCETLTQSGWNPGLHTLWLAQEEETLP